MVLLAFDRPKAYCKGLLGFGIFRADKATGEKMWLKGLKKFDLPGSDAGLQVTTQFDPIQKFHWGDYTTKPGETYTYTVNAMKGKPEALEVFEKVELVVTCETPENIGKNGHAVHWNRSSASSQRSPGGSPTCPRERSSTPTPASGFPAGSRRR